MAFSLLSSLPERARGRAPPAGTEGVDVRRNVGRKSQKRRNEEAKRVLQELLEKLK
jgi:hypothetical protein